MEIEASPPMVAKKLWNMVRVLFFMIRKGIANSKIMAELNLMVQRGKLAGKTLVNNSLMLQNQYYSSFTCRSNNSFISPHEYEFSCSNSPSHLIKHKHKHHSKRFSRSYKYDDVSALNDAVHKVLEMLNNNDEKVDHVAANYSSSSSSSPLVRQLRVTDSPFPLNDGGDSHQVDIAAEQFIQNFYKDLKLQKRSLQAAFESQYDY